MLTCSLDQKCFLYLELLSMNMEEMRLECLFSGNTIKLQTGNFIRTIEIVQNYPITKDVNIQNTSHIQSKNLDFQVRLSRAHPNQRPPALNDMSGSLIPSIEQNNADMNDTDGLNVKNNILENQSSNSHEVQWIDIVNFAGDTLSELNMLCDCQIEPIAKNGSIYFQDVNIALKSNNLISKSQTMDGLSIIIHYRVLSPYPVIEKWIEIQNHGMNWIRLDNLRIDLLKFHPKWSVETLLTPEERGSQPSIIGISNKSKSQGMILLSEVPSALRMMRPIGTMGYVDKNFEWIMGPNENFVSEKTWMFAFSGENCKTPTGISTVLDRTVEGPFQEFTVNYLNIAAKNTPLPGPVWCTWSNLAATINDTNIREQADIAEQIGFRTFQIDAGWAESTVPSDWTAGGGVPNPEKFPNFKATCDYIRSKGMKLGLWMSCYRPLESKDLREMPFGRVLPWIKRGKCVGMSFASTWRDYYVKDLLNVASTFGATYFKQDLTNIKYGDIAEGHEGRTLKDSILRGLRGFLSAQAAIHHANSTIWTMMSHELYWGTPGVPCDIAAIRSVCGYHIPPNDYSGCGMNRHRWQPSWKSKHGSVASALKRGCIHSRSRYYAMRGLPLYCLEYYGAATVNIQGSLTESIQDRQICSWLMGMPSVYAGDLCSLTDANIVHYKKRFQLLELLQQKYDIYHNFQYSGVPSPTDLGWHWWGKLNSHGEGIVVVLRGRFGSGKQPIHIPWLESSRKYTIYGCFQEKQLGTFTGNELQQGLLKITLPRWGQEVLEIHCELK